MSNEANLAQAMEEKNLGNAAYKRKDFETAIKHYEKAIALNDTEITFLSNLAAVHFEMKVRETLSASSTIVCPS